jgi:hypothetical protein
MKSRREMRGRVRAPSSGVDETICFSTLFSFSLQFPTMVEPAEVRTAHKGQPRDQRPRRGRLIRRDLVPTRVFPKLVLSQAPHDAKPEQTRQGQRQSKGLRCPERQRFGREPGGWEWIDIVNTVIINGRPPFFRGFSPPERFKHDERHPRAPTGTHNDEWVLAVGGEKRHARRGLAARIVAGDSQDSRRERREAARGATWKGREEQEGKGSQGRNLHWEGTMSGATEGGKGSRRWSGVERGRRRGKGQ